MQECICFSLIVSAIRESIPYTGTGRLRFKSFLKAEGGGNDGMRNQIARKLLSVTLLGTILSLSLAGCQASGRKKVGEPPVPMKTVSQNSREDYATFEFELPEGWISAQQSYLAVAGCPADAVDKKFETSEEVLPFMLNIRNYYYSGMALSEEDKLMYQNLFSGKTGSFEEHVNRSLSRSADLGSTPSTAKGFLDLLLPSGAGSSQSSGKASAPQRKFQYQYYDGTSGKITEVRYSYSFNGRTYQMIQCYREDIPYLITGAFDDSLDLSSGEIVLWAADSLKVTEHFTVNDHQLKKKN